MAKSRLFFVSSYVCSGPQPMRFVRRYFPAARILLEGNTSRSSTYTVSSAAIMMLAIEYSFPILSVRTAAVGGLSVIW